mmetsp:Transcript_4478/g.9190  ORF Transcript_4478/g.9190 Transcript_4478/m.9190 type:complete len:164 (+) Transcript_4478:1534-2025(+)
MGVREKVLQRRIERMTRRRVFLVSLPIYICVSEVRSERKSERKCRVHIRLPFYFLFSFFMFAYVTQCVSESERVCYCETSQIHDRVQVTSYHIVTLSHHPHVFCRCCYFAPSSLSHFHSHIFTVFFTTSTSFLLARVALLLFSISFIQVHFVVFHFNFKCTRK